MTNRQSQGNENKNFWIRKKKFFFPKNMKKRMFKTMLSKHTRALVFQCPHITTKSLKWLKYNFIFYLTSVLLIYHRAKTLFYRMIFEILQREFGFKACIWIFITIFFSFSLIIHKCFFFYYLTMEEFKNNRFLKLFLSFK